MKTFKYYKHEGMTVFDSPVKKKVGNWAEMQFDASMVRFGITWLRVFNGMGGRGDREDWVAEVPGQHISIHDYNWDKSQDFAFVNSSHEKVMLREMTNGIIWGEQRAKELEREATEFHIGVKFITTALTKQAK